MCNPLNYSADGGIGGDIAENADAVIRWQSVAQLFNQGRTREKTIANNPDMLIREALEHIQTSLAAVQSSLQ
ncbi:conserved hypothetical protein [uncultured Citrobacter sp.]|uniref:Uncharacterized protein n=1 Tax=uncultured Citrobacter sp. TaxID=200446 RepID=A0A212IP64_9ENTR|nr:conserved hypothetical protein [uncultured Citrobacter sp.]SBV68650.1 conserved hypothetical protein [uncultured Citrobacter sp.]